MRKYYYVDLPESTHTPIHEVMYGIGRVIGYAALFGGGFVIGQVVRGIVLALMQAAR